MSDFTRGVLLGSGNLFESNEGNTGRRASVAGRIIGIGAVLFMGLMFVLPLMNLGKPASPTPTTNVNSTKKTNQSSMASATHEPKKANQHAAQKVITVDASSIGESTGPRVLPPGQKLPTIP